METTDKKKHYITVLSIAGLDPSGGAGLLADVKTFAALGVYGSAVATALTVQDTLGVKGITAVTPSVVYQQLCTVAADLQPQAIKVGMVNDAPTIQAIACGLREYKPQHLVIDPILTSSSGTPLMQLEARAMFIRELLPLATLLTPNLPEACLLTGHRFSDHLTMSKITAMAQALLAKGPSAVLIKGGHYAGKKKCDWLYTKVGSGVKRTVFSAETVLTENTHGTGCTLSAAITALLARGLSLPEAVGDAKQYLTEALRCGADVAVGHGHGSVNHFFKPLPLIKRNNQ